MNIYELGSMATLTGGPFTDSTGTPTDPDGVVCRVRNPSGVVTVYTYPTSFEVIRDGEGMYHLDIALDQSRRWSYRWEGTGAVAATKETILYVRKSSVLGR